MKTAVMLMLLMTVPQVSFAGIGYNLQCPDLSGTYKVVSTSGATWTTTFSKVSADGQLGFLNAGRIWVIDGLVRPGDGNNGTLQFTCANEVLYRTIKLSAPGGQLIQSTQSYTKVSDGRIVFRLNSSSLIGNAIYNPIR
jgi:hypothetical protein